MALFGLIDWDNTKRTLKMYGCREGSLVNATATGVELILQPKLREDEVNSNIYEIFKGFDEKTAMLHIKSFAPSSSPIRFHPYESGGAKKALSGKVYGYRKKAMIGLDISVIGNSIDYYRLKALQQFYIAKDRDFDFVDLLKLTFVFPSAPGLNIVLTNGVMTTGNLGASVNGAPRIEDEVFSFQFGDIIVPTSESEQLYNCEGFVDGFLGGGLSNPIR